MHVHTDLLISHMKYKQMQQTTEREACPSGRWTVC